MGLEQHEGELTEFSFLGELFIFIHNLIITSIVFEIWLNCFAECTDKAFMVTEIYFIVISIETCKPYI